MGLTEVATRPFAVDEMAPARSVAARDDADVVRTIAEANASGEAIVIWGGGTRIGIGDPPQRYDVALDLRLLRGIVDHQPGDLTVTVRAGTTVAELQQALAPHGQWWPVEVAHPETATVGGTVASAADGPARYRYLHPRDWVIGSRAVLGDGTLVRAGGRVVKNVTGYDLSRLWSGTFGTLCAIVELSLKLAVLPERRVTLRADMPNLGFAYERTRDLLRARPPLDAVALVTGPAAEPLGSATWSSLFVRLAGTASAVDRLRRDLAGRLGALPEAPDDVWQRIADLPADAPMSVRGAWPAAHPVEVYPGSAVWYPGLEILHMIDEREVADLREVRDLAEERAGALVIERAPLAVRRALGTWGTPRVPVEIARRLRAQLDPKGVLAPGRMP